jgi:hypothetical protein
MENSLNDLKLNNTLLVELYGHSLIETGELKIEHQKEAKKEQSLKFLGNNTKKVSILVSNPGYTFLPEDQLAFLTKMLSACRMNAGDISIVNMANGDIRQQVIDQLTPLKIIEFGTETVYDLFKVDKRGGIEYLNAPDLGELVKETEEAKHLKGKLWAGLKEMFQI